MQKLICLVVAFAALATPAHAGPVAAVAAWVGSTLAAGGAAAFALKIAGSFALNAISGMLFKPKLGSGGANVTYDVQMADDLPLSFIVGDYATAGKRKYIGSWGRNTRFMTEVIEVSALPQGLAALWVNDEPGQFVANRRAYITTTFGVSGISGWTEAATVPSGALDMGQPLTNLSDDGNRIVVKWLDGTQVAADPFLVAVFGNDPDYPWTNEMIGRGKAYAIVTTRYDSETLTSYPTFLFQPSPLPVYDWRFDSNNGGSGTQRWANRATHQPSLNPAVIAYNIARGVYYGTEWVFGGKNLAAWRLPVAEWTAAANACDAVVTLASGATQARYRCGMEVRADMEPASVLEELGKAANMRFAEVGGRLKPIVDLPGAAVFSFTDGDVLITEGQSFQPFYPVTETYNAISATYPERGERWASKDAPEYVHTSAQEADGGLYLPVQMTYGAVPFARQVQRLMRAQMRDFRRMRRHQFHLPPDAYALEPGIDLVSWTSERNGYDAKLFMVESVSKTPGMNVLVSLREVDPSDYDWSSSFERPVVINTPANPRPFVQPINGLTVTAVSVPDASGTARRAAILVACNGDESGVTNIQIEWRVAGRTEVTDTLRKFSEPFAWYLLNVLPQTAYQVRARLLSDITPRSQWSDWISVTTLDVKLGSDDLRMEEIKSEVLADLEDLEAWVRGDDPIIQELRQDVDAAQAEAGQARADVAAEAARLEALALENLNIARDYTDTSIQSETVSRVAGDQALAAQIQTLTAVLNSENLLTNPQFLNGLDGWTVSNFVAVRDRNTGSDDLVYSTAPTARFVEVVPNTSSTRMFRQAFPVEFNANEVFQWRIQATSNSAGRNAVVRINWYNADGVQMGGNLETSLALIQNEWRVHSKQLTPPTGAETMRFQVIVPAAPDGASFFADAAVTRVDQSAIARITDLEVVVASNEEAAALFRTDALARFGTNEAAISNEATTRANADSALSGQISTVSAAANRVRTFRQDTAPSNPQTGDLWFDTANNSIPKRWSGSAWVNTDDTRIAQNTAAITSEATTRANADSALSNQITTVSAAANRVRTFRQDTAPASPALGDLWFDTANGNLAKVWSGSDWVNADDTRIAQTAAAITSEATARADADTALANQITTVSASADAKTRVFRSNTAPASPADFDLWINQAEGNRLYRWQGTPRSWQAVDDTRIAQNAAAITTESTARADADSAIADQLTTVEARTNRGTATGRLRVFGVSTPAGVTSRIALTAEANSGDTTTGAAMFLEARSDGIGQAIFAVDRFAIAASTGSGASRAVPFLVDSGIVYMDEAFIRDARIDTLKLAGNSVTVQWAANAYSVNINLAYPADVLIFTQIRLQRTDNVLGSTGIQLDIQRGGTVVETTLLSATSFEADNVGFTAKSFPAGSHTVSHNYTRLSSTTPSSISRPRIAVFARFR